MAKLIKGEKQYALVISKKELDFLCAIVDRIGREDAETAAERASDPDWTIWGAIEPESGCIFRSHFKDNPDSNKGYPTISKERLKKWRESSEE